MDRLAPPFRAAVAATPPDLQQMPQDVLQQILHYLPVAPARDAFRLVNTGYRAATDYLRVAGLVQARIRSQAAIASQQQAENRLTSLINDCMNSAFPAALKHSMVMELIGTLSQLPAALHAESMQFVLARCSDIGEQSGPATRRACMALCIHAYQRRTEQVPHLEKFWPVTDEEASIVADYFGADIDPAMVPFEQVVNHLEGLLAAMDNAHSMQDSDAGSQVLATLCDYCVDMFATIDGGAASLQKQAGWERLPALKAAFANKALSSLPGKSLVCQAALVSVILALAKKDSAMREQAEKEGRDLIAAIPAPMLAPRLKSLATSLLRQDIGERLIERVDAWPEPAEQLAMLRQLATLAWEKGAMPHMERICARICKLDPPDPVALHALIQANMSKPAAERIDCGTRDVIPYLLCVPTGLPRLAAFDALAKLMLVLPELKPGMKAQQRWTALRLYSMNANFRMMGIHYSSNERELERIADAAKPPTETTPSTLFPALGQVIAQGLQMFQQHGMANAKPNAKPNV